MKLDRQFGLYVIRESLVVSSTKACCRAEDPFFDRDVVLKIIDPREVGSRENLNLLDLYLESVSGLEHPAIAPIYDNGIEDDACYFTTAFYAGGSLADQLSEPMNIGKGLRIVLQLSSSLAYAYNEGFEHGKLSLKDIFFTEDGHTVITDFGIAATIEGLIHNSEQTSPIAPHGLRNITLQSLGEILIKLLLGADAKPDAISIDTLRQSYGDPLIRLTTDLLGMTKQEINSFDELLVRLTDLTSFGSEAGIDEYVEYIEQTYSAPSGDNIEVLKSAVTASQRQLEIKETVYAKDEIRRLVAEKSKLQDILRRAAAYKKQTEIKLAAGAAELEAAQNAETNATKKLKQTAPQTTIRNQTPWHHAIWMLSGMLVGVLLSGSYNHFYQAVPQNQLGLNTPSQPAPIPATESTPLATIGASLPDSPVQNSGVNTAPAQEPAERWWPVGGEFKTTTAASIEAERWWSVGDGSMSAIEQGTMQKAPDNNCREVLGVVQDWANAWSKQDQKSYFSHYSAKYRPESGRTLTEWRSVRRSRLTSPQWIRIMLNDLQLRSIGDDRVQVKLKQSYSSNTYQDEIFKSLNFVKEDDKWKISRESPLG